MISKEPIKYAKGLNNILPLILNNMLEDKVKDIIDVGVEAYENLLLDTVASKYSMADPENFYDNYVEALYNFKYIDPEDSEPILYLPDENIFKYSGQLSILQFIVEGVSGVYLELPAEDLNTLLKSKDIGDRVKRRLRALPGITDTDVPLDMRFRLLYTKGNLADTVQSILDKELVKFPFSNSSPIELFEPAQEFVDKNFDYWIDESIKKAINTVNKRYN